MHFMVQKQIIISSDKPPKDMEILEDRLRSRFEWGLIVDISAPDYETRMAILKKKEELDGYYIDDDVIEYIAKNVTSNIRELEDLSIRSWHLPIWKTVKLTSLWLKSLKRHHFSG